MSTESHRPCNRRVSLATPMVLLAILAMSVPRANAANNIGSPGESRLSEIRNGKEDIPEAYLPAESDDRETTLSKELIRNHYTELNDRRARVANGLDDPQSLYQCYRDWLNARVAFHDDAETKKAILEEVLVVARQWETTETRKFNAGVGSLGLYPARRLRIEIEIELIRVAK